MLWIRQSVVMVGKYFRKSGSISYARALAETLKTTVMPDVYNPMGLYDFFRLAMGVIHQGGYENFYNAF